MIDPAVRSGLDRLVARLQQADLGPFHAVLYGSAARNDYRKGVSDINLLLVFETVTADALRGVGRCLTKGDTPPLLFTQDEWERATDTFPIELTDMRLAYEVLHGTDPIAPLHVAPSDLRRALEREARGKLVRLRQGYAAVAAGPARLGQLAAASAGTLGLISRCTLALVGRPIPPAPEDTMRAAAEVLEVDGAVWTEVFRLRSAKSPSCTAAQFEALLVTVAEAAEALDTLSLGAT